MTAYISSVEVGFLLVSFSSRPISYQRHVCWCDSHGALVCHDLYLPGFVGSVLGAKGETESAAFVIRDLHSRMEGVEGY